MTTLHTTADTALLVEDTTPARVTTWTMTRSEWRKFATVRSNSVALLGAGAALVVFGTLFSSLTEGDGALPPNAVAGSDSLSMAFGGMTLSQLILGVLAAVFVAGEYSTGMIRSMYAAATSRLQVLWSKAVVISATTWVVMTAASFAVFFAGQAVYGGDGATYALGDDGVLRAVLGGGVYGVGIVLMGLSLGFLVRSTPAAIGTLIGALMILPGLVNLLPESASETLGLYLPSNAGQAFLSVAGSDTLLGPAEGVAVFAAWVLVLGGLAAGAVQRRDA